MKLTTKQLTLCAVLTALALACLTILFSPSWQTRNSVTRWFSLSPASLIRQSRWLTMPRSSSSISRINERTACSIGRSSS